MPTIRYTLRVVVPDDIDYDTVAEIEESASDHDTTQQAKLQRWLGGFVNDAVDHLSSTLPQGFYAKADEQR